MDTEPDQGYPSHRNSKTNLKNLTDVSYDQIYEGDGRKSGMKVASNLFKSQA